MMVIFLLALVLLIFPFLLHLGVSISSNSREKLQNQNNEHIDAVAPPSHVIDVPAAIGVNPKTSSESNTANQFFRTHSFPNTASGIGSTQQSPPDHSSSVQRKMDSSTLADDNARLHMNFNTRLGPVQCHVVDIRTLQRDQLIQIMDDREAVAAAARKTTLRLGKTMFGVTYQAATGLMIFYYQSLPSSSASSSGTGQNGGRNSSVHDAPLPLPIRIISIVTVMGFSASLVGILLHKQHPVLAAISEKLGSASAALGFFITMSVLLPGISQLIGWFAASISFIAFAYAVLKMK